MVLASARRQYCSRNRHADSHSLAKMPRNQRSYMLRTKRATFDALHSASQRGCVAWVRRSALNATVLDQGRARLACDIAPARFGERTPPEPGPAPSSSQLHSSRLTKPHNSKPHQSFQYSDVPSRDPGYASKRADNQRCTNSTGRRHMGRVQAAVIPGDSRNIINIDETSVLFAVKESRTARRLIQVHTNAEA